MAGKPTTTHATDLEMARLNLIEGKSYAQIGVMLGLGTRNTVYERMKKLKKEFPEFIQRLQEIKEYQPLIPTVENPTEDNKVAQVEVQLTNEDEPLDKIIEKQIRHLLDVSPEQIRSMKTEHRLRHVDTLTKTMRLLQGESTENVKQVSLIKCIGIATERRKPAE